MKVLKIKEHKDGGATIDFEITMAEKNLLKRVYKVKRFTSTLLRKVLVDAVNQRVANYGKNKNNSRVNQKI